MVRARGDHVAGPQRAGVAEPLVAVHDPGQGQVELGVVEHPLPGRRRDHRDEGRRCDRRRSRGTPGCRRPGPSANSAILAADTSYGAVGWVAAAGVRLGDGHGHNANGVTARTSAPRRSGVGRVGAARSPDGSHQRPAAFGGQSAQRVQQQPVGEEQRAARRPAPVSSPARSPSRGVAGAERRPYRTRPGRRRAGPRGRSTAALAAGFDEPTANSSDRAVGRRPQPRRAVRSARSAMSSPGAEDVGDRELEPAMPRRPRRTASGTSTVAWKAEVNSSGTTTAAAVAGRRPVRGRRSPGPARRDRGRRRGRARHPARRRPPSAARWRRRPPDVGCRGPAR